MVYGDEIGLRLSAPGLVICPGDQRQYPVTDRHAGDQDPGPGDQNKEGVFGGSVA
jgi:hypothetical protein